MKKAVVLGMILLALGTLAYADASVGFGWGRTQFTIAQGSDVKDADIMSGWLGPYSNWPPGMRENLDLNWSGDHTAFHITGYLQNTVMNWVNIQGTLKLMPDMFSVIIGRFDGDGFDAFRKTSPHPIRDENNSNVGRFNGWGVILDVAPKDTGLEVAAQIKTADPTAGADGFTGNVASGTIMETLSNTNVGFAYTVPNTVKIVAGSTSGTGAVDNRAHRDIFGRVELLMVPNLTAWADVRYYGFDLATKVSNIDTELAGSYDMKPLTIVLAAKFASDDKVTSLYAIPEVYYNAGAMTVGVYAKFGASDTSAFSDTLMYAVEPYVKLNDFNTRISFIYQHVPASGLVDAYNTWEIPILIDWGF